MSAPVARFEPANRFRRDKVAAKFGQNARLRILGHAGATLHDGDKRRAPLGRKRDHRRLFRRAFAFIRSIAAEGRPILFVGTKKQAQDVLVSEAERANQFFVCSRWLGGTLTNWTTIRQSIEKLRGIERMAADGTTSQMTKKEGLMLDRKRAKLERNLGGIKDMAKLPGALFVIDPVREHIAVTEANRLGIPVVAVADTNADPNQIQYVIPGNDDAIRSIKLFCTRIADACIEGSRLGKSRSVTDAVEHEAPETIRVHTGGDGPKVEIVSRRTQLPAPEAAATPEEGPLGAQYSEE